MKRGPNEYRVSGEVCYIIAQRKGVEYEIIVDTKTLEKVWMFHWGLNADGYAVTSKKINGKRKQIFLHHVVLGRKDGFETDHINRVRLDNRRSNLRFASRAENVRNTSIRKDSAHGLKGVQYFSGAKKYGARIQVNGKRLYLGLFPSKEKAHEAYLKAVQVYH